MKKFFDVLERIFVYSAIIFVLVGVFSCSRRMFTIKASGEKVDFYYKDSLIRK